MSLKVKDFDYGLPEGAIANEPAEERGGSRLLVLDRASGEMVDARYSDLSEFLREGDLLVLNDTRVMKARMKARKADGREMEIVVLEKHGEDVSHKVLYRGKLAEGEELMLGKNQLVVEEVLGGGVAVVSSEVDLLKLAEEYGVVPLPPYIKREADERDVERYQTVFARETGSAAAPTASLNMTEDILASCTGVGVRQSYITLHVGLGTFLPMRTEVVEEHKMHSEYFEIPEETVRAVREAKAGGGRVVAVGTTVARTLEYWGKTGKVAGENDIFIYPGYKFGVVDVMLTNFHAPRSTVLMMASAFAGTENLRAAYEHALVAGYKFLSYGDSMLIC